MMDLMEVYHHNQSPEDKSTVTSRNVVCIKYYLLPEIRSINLFSELQLHFALVCQYLFFLLVYNLTCSESYFICCLFSLQAHVQLLSCFLICIWNIPQIMDNIEHVILAWQIQYNGLLKIMVLYTMWGIPRKQWSVNTEVENTTCIVLIFGL
jgi:hypothetical protein